MLGQKLTSLAAASNDLDGGWTAECPPCNLYPPVGDSAWLTMAAGMEAARPQAWEPLCGSRRAELSPPGPGRSALLGPAGAALLGLGGGP